MSEFEAGQTVLLIDNKEGFPIVCENCHEHAVMKSPNARFCSEDCRFEHHGNRKPKRKQTAQTQLIF